MFFIIASFNEVNIVTEKKVESYEQIFQNITLEVKPNEMHLVKSDRSLDVPQPKTSRVKSQLEKQQELIMFLNNVVKVLFYGTLVLSTLFDASSSFCTLFPNVGFCSNISNNTRFQLSVALSHTILQLFTEAKDWTTPEETQSFEQILALKQKRPENMHIKTIKSQKSRNKTCLTAIKWSLRGLNTFLSISSVQDFYNNQYSGNSLPVWLKILNYSVLISNGCVAGLGFGQDKITGMNAEKTRFLYY